MANDDEKIELLVELIVGVSAILLLVILGYLFPVIVEFIAMAIGSAIFILMMMVILFIWAIVEVIRSMAAAISLQSFLIVIGVYLVINVLLLRALHKRNIRQGFGLKKINRSRPISTPMSVRALRVTDLFFSQRTQNEIFAPIAIDWDIEYFELISQKRFYKAKWVNVRYLWAFILAGIQKSPIFDVFELILKIAKS